MNGAALVVLELQAPRRHGSGKFGQGKEGTISSFNLGFGFGAWKASLTCAGFVERTEEFLKTGLTGQFFVVVAPDVWKRRLGCTASHSGPDTDYERRKARDAMSIKVAQALDPAVDFRPIERSPEARVPSADKACARLIAEYGRACILGIRRDQK